jgi:hypothetical protein
MAIGKPGSVATVEPALVDFGSMAERNIDKIKAEEEAKKVAQAKKEQEDLKELKDVDAFKLSGFSGWDDSLGTYVHRLHQLSIDNKELYRQTSDRKYLDNYDRIKNEINTINNESNAIADKLKQIADLYSAGKINKTVYEEKIKEFQSLNEGKAKYAYRDGRTVIGFPDEEGNIVNESTAFGYVTNLANDMPEPFNINENINTIVEKVKASENETGSALYSKTITDINSPESAPQRRRLEAAAQLFSDQNSSMTEWYLLKRDSERAKGNKMPLKTSNWTEDEKKEAKKFFLDQMIDSYQKKVSIQAQQPNKSGDGSGGGKEKDVITPSSEVAVRRIKTTFKGKEIKSVNNGYAVGLGGKPVTLKDRTREYVEMGYDEGKKSLYVKVRDYFPQSDPRSKKKGAENGVVRYIYEKGQKPEVDKALKRIVNPNTGVEFEGAKDADNYIKSLDTYKSYLKDIESKKETPAERAARIASGK